MVLVHSLDRLGRNGEDLLPLVRTMNEQGVSVEFVTNNLRFGAGDEDQMSKLMLTLLAAFAEFGRSMIRSRQSEGIAIAKNRGCTRR